jgi:hypothetical protein
MGTPVEVPVPRKVKVREPDIGFLGSVRVSGKKTNQSP